MTRLPEIANPPRKPYQSDLSDAEWEVLKPLLPQTKGFGHPVEVDFREILNGIFYVQRSGCQWEMMPHDLPPYSTVYRYFQLTLYFYGTEVQNSNISGLFDCCRSH